MLLYLNIINHFIINDVVSNIEKKVILNGMYLSIAKAWKLILNCNYLH